jgi:hypothetical protein
VDVLAFTLAGAGVVVFALAGADAAVFAVAVAGALTFALAGVLVCALAGAGVGVPAFALAETGLADVTSAGAAAGTADGLAAFVGAVMLEAALEPVDSEAVGAGAEGDVETTTVDDLTSVVVHAPDVVVALDEGAGAAAAGVLEEGAAARDVFGDGAGAAGAVVELPALDDTFEPVGAAGDGGGEACLVAVIVVSRSAVTVVSRRTGPAFDALRTLSVGRAGEADRAVAKRTCSIIAE